MSTFIAWLKTWISGSPAAGIPQLVEPGHTEIVTPLVTPLPVAKPGAASPCDVTIIAEGTSIEGAIDAPGAVVVAGSVRGDVAARGNVLVVASGLVHGAVSGHDVEIHGRVDGPMRAQGELIVRSGGTVLGPAEARTIAVDQGGMLDGRCNIGIAPIVVPIEGGRSSLLPAPPPWGVMQPAGT